MSKVTVKREVFVNFYSPSPEYPVACYRDEWRGEPRRSSKSEGGLALAQFRFDTPQLAAGSFIIVKVKYYGYTNTQAYRSRIMRKACSS